jgi:hypothetical protein
VPLLLGMILGVLLTVAGAYSYDTVSGRAPHGLPPSASEPRPMVNWDIVSDDWQSVKTNLHELGANLERGWKRLTG